MTTSKSTNKFSCIPISKNAFTNICIFQLFSWLFSCSSDHPNDYAQIDANICACFPILVGFQMCTWCLVVSTRITTQFKIRLIKKYDHRNHCARFKVLRKYGLYRSFFCNYSVSLSQESDPRVRDKNPIHLFVVLCPADYGSWTISSDCLLLLVASFRVPVCVEIVFRSNGVSDAIG